MFKDWIIVTALTAALLGFSSLAYGDEVLRGKITDLNLTNGEGTLTVREKGTNALRTVGITDNTKVTYRATPSSSRITRRVDARVADMQVGNDVRLDVRTAEDGSLVVLGYEVVPVVMPARQDRQDEPMVAATDTNSTTDYGYDRLPATATPLPLFALVGFSSVLAGIGVRRVRKRLQS